MGKKKDKKEKEFVKKIGDMVLGIETDLKKVAKEYGWSEEEAVLIFTTSLMRFTKKDKQERLAYE